MSQENFQQWQKNLGKKINEVESACFQFVSSDPQQQSTVLAEHRKTTYHEAQREVSNLFAMYGGGNQPPEILHLHKSLEYIHKQRNDPNSLPKLLKAIKEVKNIPRTGMHYVSFHDIYEQYREDGELNSLVDQLIETLEKIISSDDGSMSSRVEKDLTRLLDQIKNRPNLSTYEIGAWSELTGRFLLELIGQKHGIPSLSLAVDATKLAKRVFENVVEKYQASQSEYVRLIGLKSAPQEFSSLPPLSDSEIQKAEIKAAEDGSSLGLISVEETLHPPESAPEEPPSP